ncbi:MAG: RES family NAD+ phosphorylase [Verrucomicrobiota bacterium]
MFSRTMGLHNDIEPALFLDVDDKYVCEECVFDDGLKAYFSERCSPSGVLCSYCGGSAKSIPVADLQAYVRQFFRYVAIETVSPRVDGEWVVPGKDAEDCLEELLRGHVSDAVFDDLSNNLLDYVYCEPDWSTSPLTDQWKGQWEDFSKHVQYDGTDFYFAKEVIHRERNHDERHPLEFYNAIAAALLRADALSLLPSGTPITRVRETHVPKEFLELTSPPAQFAGANRFSPQGVAMFYGATDFQTACKEIKVPEGTPITKGEFATIRDLALIDFTATKIPRGKFDPDWIGNYHIAEFLEGFLADIRKDVKGQPASPEYLPTQALCDFFVKRGADELLGVDLNNPEPLPVMQLIERNRKVDGIRFHSAKVTKGNADCVVLFCDQIQSASLLKLVQAEHTTTC